MHGLAFYSTRSLGWHDPIVALVRLVISFAHLHQRLEISDSRRTYKVLSTLSTSCIYTFANLGRELSA